MDGVGAKTLDQKMKAEKYTSTRSKLISKAYISRNLGQFIAQVSRLISSSRGCDDRGPHQLHDRIKANTIPPSSQTRVGARDEPTPSGSTNARAGLGVPRRRPQKGVEAQFTRGLEAASEVAIYAKLPRNFKSTPVGNYAPALGRRLPRGRRVEHIFFIAGNQRHYEQPELRGIEDSKIRCAERLFNELQLAGDVHYEQADTYEKLMERVRSL